MSVYALGALTLDLGAGQIRSAGTVTQLAPMDTALLRYLVAHPGRAVPRDELLERVWGYRPGAVTRTVDVTVSRLRKKLEPDPVNPQYLLTIHGGGYQLVLPTPPPEAPEDLVGRAAELGQIVAWAREDRSRALVVVGLGGIGKSRLTSEALTVLEGDERWQGRVHRLHLGEAPAGEPLFAAMLRALGVGDDGETPLVRLGAFWGDEPALVLLDELEGFGAEVERLPALLDAAPGLRILGSSRRDPATPGVSTLRLERLAPEDARRLLLLRSPGRVARQLDGDVLDALVAETGGVPLVLELVAATLRYRSPADVLTLFRRRPEALVDPDRDGPAHHQSIRDCVARSLELLDARLGEALGRLSSLLGPFDDEVAEGAAGVDPAIVGELAAFSLLTLSEGGLTVHPLVRACAPTLVASEAPRYAEHRRRWFLAWASRLALAVASDPQLPRGPVHGRLRRAAPDLLAALDASLDQDDVAALAEVPAELWTSCARAGIAQLVVPRLERACSRADAPPHLRLAWAERSVELGLFGQAERALEPLMAAPPDELRVAVLVACSLLCARTLQVERARALGLEAMAAAEQDGRLVERERATRNLARVMRLKPVPVDAAAHAARAAAVARELGRPEAIAETLRILGMVHESAEELELAHAAYVQALTLAQSLEDRALARAAQNSLGNVYRRMGRLAEAAEAYQAALTLARQDGNLHALWANSRNLSLIRRDQGALDEAEQLVRAQLDLSTRAGWEHDIPTALAQLGNLELTRGRLEAARAWFTAGVARAGPESIASVEARWALAMTAWRAGDLDAAEAELAQVAEHPIAQGVAYVGLVRLSEALVLAARGDPEALARARSGLVVAPVGTPTFVPRGLAYAAWVLARLGHVAPARAVLGLVAARPPSGFYAWVMEDAAARVGGMPEAEVWARDATGEALRDRCLEAVVEAEREAHDGGAATPRA